MKKLISAFLIVGTLAGASAQAHIEEEMIETNQACKDLAQHILKARAQETLVKAQIKMADSKAERKNLEAKLDKIKIDIGSSKEEYRLACQPL